MEFFFLKNLVYVKCSRRRSIILVDGFVYELSFRTISNILRSGNKKIDNVILKFETK